jgi:hypothetical protein
MTAQKMAYQGIGKTLDEAISAAHDKIPPREGRDFAVSRVVELGMQRGGFTMERLFLATVIEDEFAPFNTKD